MVFRAAKNNPVASGTVSARGCTREVLKSNSTWSAQRLSQVAEPLSAHKASLTRQSPCACVSQMRYDWQQIGSTDPGWGPGPAWTCHRFDLDPRRPSFCKEVKHALSFMDSSNALRENKLLPYLSPDKCAWLQPGRVLPCWLRLLGAGPPRGLPGPLSGTTACLASSPF